MIEQDLNGELRTASNAERSDRHPVDVFVMLLLVVGFFLGPLKLLGTSWFSYLSADGLAVLILLAVLGERVAKRKPVLAATQLSLPILLLAMVCFLELLNPEAPFFRSVLGLRSWMLYLAFYFVGYYTLRSVKQVERIYALLLVLGVVTAVYGVYQWRAGPQSFANWSAYYGQYAQLAWVAQSGRVFRAFSTFVAPGTFGGNMALVMLLAFSVAAASGVRKWWRVGATVAFGVMGLGIAATGSRGPVAHLMLAGALGLAFVPGVRGKLTVGVLSVLAVSVAALLIVQVIGTVVTERYSSIFDPQGFFWKWFIPFRVGLGVAVDHPLGMGLGYTAGIPQFIPNPVFRDLPLLNVDSGYGSAAAELGLLGLGFFAFFAAKVGIEGFRAWKALVPSRMRDLLLGPAMFAVAYPFVSVIFQPQATLPSSIYFWLLIGMLMKAPILQRQVDADQVLRPQMHAGQ